MSRSRLRDLLPWAGTLALFAACALVTVLWLRLQGSVVRMDGSRVAAGLHDTVVVRLDSLAIPHIDAADDHDVLFAEGWMHASERLWQMELLRRTARGRLAAVFGPRALPTDRLLRTLGVWEAAGRTVDSLDVSVREDLAAYVAGVNAWIESRTAPLPPEFALLGIRPEPWTARATAAVGKLMALDLSSWSAELSRWHASRVLPPEKYAEIRPRWPDWAPTILESGLPPGVLTRGAGASGRPSSPVDLAARPATESPGPGRLGKPGAGPDPAALDPLGIVSSIALTASNAWVLDGERTSSGRPLLANDTHLGLRAPSIWYAVGLHARSGRITAAGVSIPGVPGVIIGMDRGGAWGFTNAMVDDMDFAVEAVNLDGSDYRTERGWRDFRVRAETLQVRGRDDPEILHVRSTIRGPVLSDVLPNVNETLSAVWTHAHTTGGLGAILAMDRATGWAAFDSALSGYDGPAQNVLWAGSDGRIGYRMAGAVPRRSGWDGSAPVSSREMGPGWTGLVSPDSLPAATFGAGTVRGRPPEGFLASANNLPSPGRFGEFGVDYDPFRARRIVDRLSQARGWGVEEMEALQRDDHSLLADLLLGQAVGAARGIGADTVATLLSAWDRDADGSSRAAGVFYTWLYRLRSLVAADEYGGGGGRAWFPMQGLLDIVLRRPESPWIDDVRTDSVETLAGLERRAMADAIRVTGLRPWRELNLERSGHPLGRSAGLDRVFHFDVGPRPVAGGPHTVRVAAPDGWASLDSTSWRPPHVGGFGPSERFVAELDPGGPRGWILLPTGQGGNPLDRHYRDMAARWGSTGTLVPLPLDIEAIRAVTVSRLRLFPAGGG